MNRPNISQVWQYQAGDDFKYPEQDEQYNDFFDNKSDFGISFSGGGTRSAICTFGQLRGLRDIGLLQKAKYIASNSGGTWGSLPYIYYKGNLDDYFSGYLTPENITPENITSIPSSSFLNSPVKAGVVAKILFNRLKNKGDESFAQTMGSIFLKPYNINYTDHFFTLNNESFNTLKQNNLQIEPHDFEMVSTCGEERPFHIANGTLHNWKLSRKKEKRNFHIEMTPLYTGVKVFHENRGDQRTSIGGGYVDPFAFDTIFKGIVSQGHPSLIKVDSPTTVNHSPEGQFTLADIIGISGSALTSIDPSVNASTKQASKLLKKKNFGTIAALKVFREIINGLPEAHYFSPHDISNQNLKTIEYNVGDGGPVDDIALMPLLARGVKKVFCFCNVQTKVLKVSSNGFHFKKSRIDKDVLCFFGLKRSSISKKLKYTGGFQQVFDQADFEKMSSAFTLATKNNKPLIYVGEHTVLPNKHFGIKGGYLVKIMWFYNERCKSWEDQLDKTIRAQIGAKGIGKRLKNFPNFKTFGENGFRIIDMHAEQATLLANYHTWIIQSNKNHIHAFLNSP